MGHALTVTACAPSHLILLSQAVQSRMDKLKPHKEKERLVGLAKSCHVFPLLSLLCHVQPHCPLSVPGLTAMHLPRTCHQALLVRPNLAFIHSDGARLSSLELVGRVSVLACIWNPESGFLWPSLWSPLVSRLSPFGPGPHTGVTVKTPE